jgi:hypothetical protein
VNGRYDDVFYAETSIARASPTAKQKKFFDGLCRTCRENGLSEKVGFRLFSRSDYTKAIGVLLARLQNAGVYVPRDAKDKEDCDEKT